MKIVKGIYLPDGDTHFEYHLMKGPEFHSKGTYQFKKISRALKVIERDPDKGYGIAVDVGAHVGLWSRVLSYYFRIVHAFEPVKEFRDCLYQNVVDTPYEVKLYDLAVSDNSGGLRTMNIVNDNTGQSHLRPASEGGIINTPEHPLVATVALDDIDFGGRVDFIKIDVEGSELEVLKGAKRLLTDDHPIVVLEQKGGNAERYGLGQYAALDYIKKLGYEPVWESSGDYCVQYKRRKNKT
jgi:FkbM family methyltransferase